MPAIYVTTFPVRHYECDAYGHVNNANYLRYMQEAAFGASAAVGYGAQRYEAEGLIWLAYETDVDYLLPLRYGDTVEIKTWVADWRRVRSLRMYEFRRAGSDELIARAQTDWVLLDAKTQYPTTIKPEIIAAYSAGDSIEPAPARKRFAPAPPPPPGMFTHRRTVEWRDIDMAQHVNNAVYLNYLEECTILAAEAHRWPVTRSNAEGFAIIARQHHIEYKLPAMMHDELHVSTWASEAKNFSAMRHYTITRPADGKLLVQASTQWVFVDLANSRLVRVPKAFLDDFAPNIVS
jgi:acyl-CoA thioester hydrolase